jgi:thioredoxin-related protein
LRAPPSSSDLIKVFLPRFGVIANWREFCIFGYVLAAPPAAFSQVYLNIPLMPLFQTSPYQGLVALAVLVVFSGFRFESPPEGSPIPAKKAEAIQWLTFEEAVAKQKVEPKKIFIDVYTDWCGWCKKMDKATFSDPEVAKLVNKHFYAVKLNAEGKKPITVNGRTYNYSSEFRSHELVVDLLQGRMSYPTTVFLDEKLNMLSPVPGYLAPDIFSKIIKFYGENHYKNTPWEEYEAQVKK